MEEEKIGVAEFLIFSTGPGVLSRDMQARDGGWMPRLENWRARD